MAYIQPNSTVQFFGDLGISPNYENTLYFQTEQAKTSYFDALTPIATASSISYQREHRGFIRVELPMSQMYNVGYMRFKNTSFENKWFYAFVKRVNYINNITTEVEFELDVVMTWMGVFSLKQCFIERQHSETDAIGDNTTEENLDLGQYICEGTETHSGGAYYVVCYKSYNKDKDSGTPVGIIQGTYLPIISFSSALDAVSIALFETLLEDIVDDNRADEILTLKLVPTMWLTNGTTVPTDTKAITKPYTYTGASTYIPRNKKLFTYPFKYLEVENCEGDSTVYMYEYFNTNPPSASSGSCNFLIMGSASTPEPVVMCTPSSYKGEQYAYDEGITMQNFPTIAWNVDGYKAYLAQRDSTLFGNRVASALTGAASGALTGGMAGGVAGAITGATIGGGLGMIRGSSTLIADTANEMSKHNPTRVPNQTRGNSDSNIMVQSNHKAFYFRMMCITKAYAERIDQFFDMYGYAMRKVATPNMNARTNWTYVKTIGCTVEGNLPTDDAKQIENIFDNGIRFWKNHNNIGNYALSNSPT